MVQAVQCRGVGMPTVGQNSSRKAYNITPVFVSQYAPSRTQNDKLPKCQAFPMLGFPNVRVPKCQSFVSESNCFLGIIQDVLPMVQTSLLLNTLPRLQLSYHLMLHGQIEKTHTHERLCLTQHLLAQTHVFFLHGLAVSYWQYRMCHISHILLEHNGIGRLGVNLFFI